MPSRPPLVTFAVPTYNCAAYLPDAIGSIIRQGISDYEIVIVDNASEDDTEGVVASFASPQIRYFRNPSNLGSRENGRRCLAYARGQYIRFVCADDVLLDGIVAKQLRIMEEDPLVAIVSCDNFITDERLNRKGAFRAFPGRHPGSRIINACLSGVKNYIGGPSNVMFRREMASRIEPDDSYNAVSDWKYYLQLLEYGWYVNAGAPGYLYRLHATSDTQANCPLDLRKLEHLRLVTEMDGWNVLSCIGAVHLAGDAGWQIIRDHWREAIRPSRLAAAMAAFPDVLRMYLFWHFGQSASPATHERRTHTVDRE